MQRGRLLVQADRMKRLSAITTAVLLTAPIPANAEGLGRMFTEVSQRTDVPVMAVTRTLVPFNGTEPFILVTLINCLDQTEAFFNVNTEKLEIRKFNASWQSELCSNRSR